MCNAVNSSVLYAYIVLLFLKLNLYFEFCLAAINFDYRSGSP